MTQKNLVQIFDRQQVRSIYDTEQEKWFVSVTDVIAVLTGSDRPRKYWSDLKKKLAKEESELSEKNRTNGNAVGDGKYYKTDVANLEPIFTMLRERVTTELSR